MQSLEKFIQQLNKLNSNLLENANISLFASFLQGIQIISSEALSFGTQTQEHKLWRKQICFWK